MPADLKYLFVLMLENRSFDHMFGFSGLTGVDAQTGEQTSIDGLKGNETNSFNGTSYPVTRGADDALFVDPPHEFLNVLDHLCGPAATYPPGGAYPPINNSGFVDSYARGGGAGSPGDVMKCFDTARQLPVIYTLAKEFAICDNWYASLPGPTWPNRMFSHAASSAGLDHSPSSEEIVKWETVDGFQFPHGSLYSLFQMNGVKYRFYAGDRFPMVAALKYVNLGDIQTIDTLKQDLGKNPFPYGYCLIEPSYNVTGDYRNSSCQHPLADVTAGEALIKEVYEALRNSAAWPSSMLIITWDEHGGFYDHRPPPQAIAPGDGPYAENNQYGFTFTQYGPRVPAVIVSPLIPRNTIDHRLYDHASIPATAEKVFGMAPLTQRDGAANSLKSLASLDIARTNAPTTLPAPVETQAVAARAAGTGVSRPNDPVNGAALPTIVHAAMRQDLQASAAQIRATVANIRTRADADAYLKSAEARIQAARVGQAAKTGQ